MNRNCRVFRITIGTLTAMSLLSNISSISLANYNYELEQELIANTYDFGPPPYDKVTSDAYDFSPPPYDKVINDAYDFSPPSYDEKIDDNTNFNSSTYYDDNQDYTNSYGSWDDTTDNTNNYESFSDSICESPKIYSPTNDFKQALGTDVVLKWEQNGETPDYYMLYFWGVGDGSSIEIPGNSLTYTIDSNYFNTEGTYVLGLYAVNDAGQSDVSSINISLYSFKEVIISNMYFDNNNDYAPLNTDYILDWRHAGKIVANQYVVQVLRDGEDIYNESILSTSKPYKIPGYVFNKSGTYVIGIYAKYGPLQNQTAINVIVDEKIDAEREKAVKYMKDMAEAGIPYSQTYREINLENFNKDDKTRGNDCSSAVSMAWQQVNPSFKICATPGMYPTASYISTVGDYDYSGKSNTKEICKDNGIDKMKLAYKKLKKGDAVMYDNGGGDYGHIRMVVSNDIENEKITCVEHTGGGWLVDVTYSYDELFYGTKRGYDKYIPITMTYWKQK